MHSDDLLFPQKSQHYTRVLDVFHSHQNLVLFVTAATCILVTGLSYNVWVMKADVRSLQKEVKSLQEEMRQLQEVSRGQQRLVSSFVDAARRPSGVTETSVVKNGEVGINSTLDGGLSTTSSREDDAKAPEDSLQGTDIGSGYMDVDYYDRELDSSLIDLDDDEDKGEEHSIESLEAQWLKDVEARAGNLKQESVGEPKFLQQRVDEFKSVALRKKRSAEGNPEWIRASNSDSEDPVESSKLSARRKRTAGRNLGTENPDASSEEESQSQERMLRRGNKGRRHGSSKRGDRPAEAEQGGQAIVEEGHLVAHYEARWGEGRDKFHVSALAAPGNLDDCF